MTKSEPIDDIDPELLGRIGHISRARNLSMTQVKNMVLKVGLSQMGETTEYDAKILEFRLLNQRLDILLADVFELQSHKLGDKFSVGYISATMLKRSDCTPDVFYLWEEEMMRLLVDIECTDSGIFRKIKQQLKNLKRLWRLYPDFKENYLESRLLPNIRIPYVNPVTQTKPKIKVPIIKQELKL